jgi:hypothetical protein
VESRYVGIDLHRRRSVIYSMDVAGEKLDCVRIANDPLMLLEAVGGVGSDAEVVVEATYGWYWAVDLLQEQGAAVHLAHPSGNDWGNRRVKNDERRSRPRRPVAPGSSGGGVDRAAGGAGGARAGALSSQARPAALGPEGPGARGDGQRGRAARTHGHVLCRWPTRTRPDGARRRVSGPGRVAAGPHRGLRP